jgi:hypothetical protein
MKSQGFFTYMKCRLATSRSATGKTLKKSKVNTGGCDIEAARSCYVTSKTDRSESGNASHTSGCLVSFLKKRASMFYGIAVAWSVALGVSAYVLAVACLDSDLLTVFLAAASGITCLAKAAKAGKNAADCLDDAHYIERNFF